MSDPTPPPSSPPPPGSSFILYQTEDGRTRIECRFEGETLWLSQALMAELFQIGVNTVNHDLSELYAEKELDPSATIRQYRIVRSEGSRQVARDIEHYNLAAIIAVGYRVRSHLGTQFRQWATARLSEYLVKGFTMDDERLKNPPRPRAKRLLRGPAGAHPRHPLFGTAVLPKRCSTSTPQVWITRPTPRSLASSSPSCRTRCIRPATRTPRRR